MAIINALIPSASADVVAIFPELLPLPRVPVSPDIANIPGVAPILGVSGVSPTIGLPGLIPIQVFADARPMRVQVSEPAQFMVHPLEDGTQVTDHRIILPVELTISFILRPERYRITYQLIKQAFLASLRFSVQTKTETYTGMYISDIPHEEDPALFDTITMVVQFREVQFFAAQVQALSSENVADAPDESPSNGGEVSPTPANDSQNNRGSVLYRTFARFL